jgi:hypothetical protein
MEHQHSVLAVEAVAQTTLVAVLAPTEDLEWLLFVTLLDQHLISLLQVVLRQLVEITPFTLLLLLDLW